MSGEAGEVMRMPNPFYKNENGELYHGDCFDFFASPPHEYLGTVAAVV
jgi:hypothetical protein